MTTVFPSDFVGASHRFDRQKAMRLYSKGRTDEQIAAMCGVSMERVRCWRMENGLDRNEEYKPNTAQCKGCIYWRSLASGAGFNKACHHLLDTNKRRIDEDGVCKSRRAR